MSDHNKRHGKMPIDPRDDVTLFDNEFSVESVNDCTGLVPAGQVDEAKAESYSDIYDIPISQIRCNDLDEQ